MPRTFTLAQLRSRAAERADMTVSSTSFVTTSELNGYLSASYARLYNMLADAEPERFVTTAVVNAVTGTATYAVPADHYRTMGVDYRVNATDWTSLYRLNLRERNRYAAGTGGRAFAYLLSGGNLVLYPAPTTGQTYRHLYLPTPADLTGQVDAYTVDGISGFEEFLVLDAAIKMLHKQNVNASHLIAERQYLIDEIREMATDRIAAEPHSVIDINEQYGESDAADWRWR